MRMIPTIQLAVLTGCLFVAPAAFGQTIQLPTIQIFSVATTVVVPDRGSMQLGGVDRASFGGATFGVPGLGSIPGAGRLFKNRAIGSEMGTQRLSVTATIIDHDEWDRAILAQAAAQRADAAANTVTSRKAAFLAQHMARNARPTAPDDRRPPPVRAAAAPKRGVIREER